MAGWNVPAAVEDIFPVKKSKNLIDPNSYRPISLMCTIGKIFEKMINNLFVSILEKYIYLRMNLEFRTVQLLTYDRFR